MLILMTSALVAASPPGPPPRMRPFPGGDAAECAVAVEVIADFAKGRRANVNPVLSHIPDRLPLDCTQAFKGAGFSAYQKPVQDPASHLSVVTVSASRIRLSDATHASMDIGMVCGGLCGEGHSYTLEFTAGRWRITGRKATWLS